MKTKILASLGLILIVPIVLLGLVTGYLYILKWQIAPDLFYNPTAWETTGLFGDSFGALTACFSALAFGGVIYSLIQSENHSQQNKKEAQKQNFDGVFFNMLNSFNSMKTTQYDSQQIAQQYANNLSATSAISNYHRRDDIKHYYDANLNHSIKLIFAQYLTSFDFIVELILTESSTPQRHLRYFFGQISNYEKVILLYHFEIGENSQPKLYPMFHTELFRSLRENPNAVITHHFGFFEGLVEKK